MFIYLASPYTNNPEENFKKVEFYTAQQLQKGICIFSPIVHCHEIASKHSLPKDFNFWQTYNLNMLGAASALHILVLKGWEDSVGVQAELDFAIDRNIPVVYKVF